MNAPIEQELLPCAHCGGEAAINSIPFCERWPTSHYVQCVVCEARAGTEDYSDDAIMLWNTRATPKPSGEVNLSLTVGELRLAEDALSVLVNSDYGYGEGLADLLTVIRSQTKGVGE